MLQAVGRWLSRYLEDDRRQAQPYVSQDFDALCQTIRVGDVLLVEGGAKVSTAIKYLTQSTWSHAALCVSDASHGAPELVEVTMRDGCQRVPLAKYKGRNTRLCRAASLSVDDRAAVARYMVDNIGIGYDLRNIWDMARYLIPTPPVPARFRRRMLAMGSGDPTRAICSSLIARAFQSVRYPILPTIESVDVTSTDPNTAEARAELKQEILRIRHHSLYTPRDFDLSPYFAVVKPSLAHGFDHHRIRWAETAESEAKKVG